MSKISKAIDRSTDQQEPVYRLIELKLLNDEFICISCHAIISLIKDNGNVEITLVDGSTIKVQGSLKDIAHLVWGPGSEMLESG